MAVFIGLEKTSKIHMRAKTPKPEQSETAKQSQRQRAPVRASEQAAQPHGQACRKQRLKADTHLTPRTEVRGLRT